MEKHGLVFKEYPILVITEHHNKYKVERPTKEILEFDVLNMPMTSVGKKYGVSDNAIRKWCKCYNITIHKFKCLRTDREKMLLKHKMSKPIIQVDVSGNLIREFISAKEASKALNVSSTSIGKVCNHKRKHTRGLYFKFKLQS